MKIYFAGGLQFPEIIEKAKVRNVLSSWLENKSEYYPDYNVFLDSGAFSAHTKGIKIDIQEYIKHIKDNEQNLDAYAGLDVIHNAEATYENQKIMEAAGITPVPTYHQFEDEKYLHLYLKQYNYIALGGMVGSGERYLRPFLENCFAVIKKHWPKKIHGFGINALWALKRYPFYSVDSTSWQSGARFGSVFEPTLLRKGLPKHKHNKHYTGSLDWKELFIKNSQTYLKLERDITKLWERRGIIWKD